MSLTGQATGAGKTLRLLHLEDNPDFHELVGALLEREGLPVEMVLVGNHADFAAALEKHTFDIILGDYKLPTCTGIEALKTARQQCPDTPFILVSGAIGEQAAIESLKSGATDYVLKQWPERLGPAVRRAVQVARERAQYKQAEARLRLQSAALESAANAIVITDRAGTVLWVNPSFSRLTGYSTEEIVGQNPRLLKSDVQDQAFYKNLWETILAGRVWQAEMVNRRKDGSLYTEENTITPVRSQEGEIAHFIAVKHDITGRKQAEAQIRKLAAFPELNPNPVLEFSSDGALTYSNPAAQALARTLSGLDVSGLLPPNTPDLVRQCLATGVPQLRLETQLGPRTLSSSFYPIPHLSAVHCYLGDITGKKKLEAQVLRAQRVETIGALAGGIAHDLNNVLAPVMMAADLLDAMPLDETARGIVAMVRGSAQRGADLVKQILFFARGVAGEPAALQVKHLVSEMAKLAEETFPRSIRIEKHLARDLLPVLGNATQLHQVLLNLCVNARDAMPKGGVLHLEAGNVALKGKCSPWHTEPVSGQFVVLTVADTGTGMPPEVAGRIFEPFFTTKEANKGTGLGLSTLEGIVKAHGGFVEVTSQLNQGTTFKVYLPAAAEMAADVKGETEHVLPKGQGEQILVVDDEQSLLEFSRRLLAGNGYRALTAMNGFEALALYQQHPGDIHAMITDMMMPGMDGLKTAEALRELNPAVKIIGVSGLGEESELVKAARHKVDVLLQKPYRAEELLAALHRLLQTR